MSALAAEARRINVQMRRMTWKDSYAAEVPLRLHDHGPDAGHGLGGPALSAAFIAYLRDSGVCMCEPREIEGYMVMRHFCDRKREQSMQRAFFGEKFHTRRIKRALRQLRLICYEEWAIVFPILARNHAWPTAVEWVNSGRSTRGQDPIEERDLVILAISGMSKIAASY